MGPDTDAYDAPGGFTVDFQLPESLATLSLEELSALEAQAYETSQSIVGVPDDDVTDAQLDLLEAAASGLEAIQSERAQREARSRRVANVRSRMTEASSDEAAPEQAPESPAEEASESSDETDDVAEATPVSEDTKTETEEEAVTASAGGSAVRNVARKNPDVPISRGTAVMSVAPDVPGFSASNQLESMTDVAKAFQSRIAGFAKGPTPPGSAGRIFQRYGVARISRGDFGGLTDLNPEFAGNPQALLDEAGRESRVGESLVAAGGWCAPSETLYDLCEMETADGLVDIPEVNITRGGIRFTQGPDFSAIYNNVGFCQTEAQAEAGLEKLCFDVPCPDFEEVRLDACGICIRAGILTNVGYPELVARWIRGSMVAHQHKMSAKVINSMATLLGPAQLLTGFDSLTASTLSYVEALVQGQREAFRLSQTATLEGILPSWVRGAIRADMALRTGADSFMNVTNAQIDEWFATRGARIQWVYNYQPLAVSEATGCIGGYPTSVEGIFYPAGTFIKGVADVISLDAVYDTAGLQENTYTALFFEEGILVAKRCHGGCRVSLPVCISGLTGAAILEECQVIGTPLSS